MHGARAGNGSITCQCPVRRPEITRSLPYRDPRLPRSLPYPAHGNGGFRVNLSFVGQRWSRRGEHGPGGLAGGHFGPLKPRQWARKRLGAIRFRGGSDQTGKWIYSRNRVTSTMPAGHAPRGRRCRLIVRGLWMSVKVDVTR